ncbi:MAG: TlpA disulfide reductase family protein [Pseudomonadota bacterium]
MFSQNTDSRLAPSLRTAGWLNTKGDVTLDDLKGKVVVLVAFQMLCPGCVARSIPMALRLERLFDRRDVAVVGLHTVFEHHHVMTPAALEVFLAEYRVGFPVGIDRPDPAGGNIPVTMQAYGMRGTPTVVLIDAEGRRRAQHFGAHDELLLGAEIGALLAERDGARLAAPVDPVERPTEGTVGCETGACEIRA